MTSHVATTRTDWRPAALPGCETCTARGDGQACVSCFRRYRDHGRPAGGVPPVQTCGQRPGVNALFWRWLDYCDHRRPQADLAHELGVSRRTLTRWAHRRDAMIAAGTWEPPRTLVSAGKALKLSDSGYGAHGTNAVARGWWWAA